MPTSGELICLVARDGMIIGGLEQLKSSRGNHLEHSRFSYRIASRIREQIVAWPKMNLAILP